jgi:hypothetical protein
MPGLEPVSVKWSGRARARNTAIKNSIRLRWIYDRHLLWPKPPKCKMITFAPAIRYSPPFDLVTNYGRQTTDRDGFTTDLLVKTTRPLIAFVTQWTTDDGTGNTTKIAHLLQQFYYDPMKIDVDAFASSQSSYYLRLIYDDDLGSEIGRPTRLCWPDFTIHDVQRGVKW